jgi:hypothetical protein
MCDKCKNSKFKMAFHFYTMAQKNKMIALLYTSQKRGITSSGHKPDQRANSQLRSLVFCIGSPPILGGVRGGKAAYCVSFTSQQLPGYAE